ncbi:MAG: hypothetical protein IIW17_08740, partial [Clostridia bacterium]|nr:hypothetical protein [Clostridia bacterium]
MLEASKKGRFFTKIVKNLPLNFLFSKQILHAPGRGAGWIMIDAPAGQMTEIDISLARGRK